jgi:hypothetical protein
MPNWCLWWQFATSGGVPRRSLIAAIVVGMILNLINQGDALFGAKPIDWVKAALTFLVPYCVTTYGAVSFRISAMREASLSRGKAGEGP